MDASGGGTLFDAACGPIVASGDVCRDAVARSCGCFRVAGFGLFVSDHLASIYGSAARFSPATVNVLYASEISGHCGVSLGPRGALVAHDVCLGWFEGRKQPLPARRCRTSYLTTLEAVFTPPPPQEALVMSSRC